MGRNPKRKVAELKNTGSELAREGLHDGQNLAHEFIPARDLAGAGFLEGGFRLALDNAVFKKAEAFRAILQMRVDAVAQVAGGKLAEAGLGSEMLLAHPGQIHRIHRAERTQPAQPFARGAFADAEPLDDVIQRQRLLGAEKQPVDFADGSWQRQRREGMDKKRNGLKLEAVQRGM